MLDKKVAELINTQVNKEFYSAYLYLDFANYYKDAELNGFSNWYQVPVSYTHLCGKRADGMCAGCPLSGTHSTVPGHNGGRIRFPWLRLPGNA